MFPLSSQGEEGEGIMGEALVPEEEMCGGSSRGVRGVVPEDIQIHIGQEIRYGRTCTVGKNAVLEPWVVSGRVCFSYPLVWEVAWKLMV